MALPGRVARGVLSRRVNVSRGPSIAVQNTKNKLLRLHPSPLFATTVAPSSSSGIIRNRQQQHDNNNGNPSSFAVQTAWFSSTTTDNHQDDNTNDNHKSSSSSSSSGDDEESSNNFDSMSFDQLEQLVGKFCRQDNPHQAQRILETLEERQDDNDNDNDNNDNNNDNLEANKKVSDNLKTTVMDAWTKYQAVTIRKLLNEKESNVDINIDDDNGMMMTIRNSLEQIYHAAECTSDIVESMENPSSHHYVAALTAWANVCEAVHDVSTSTTTTSTSTSYKDIVRGIPQRAQYLSSYQEEEGPKPTIEALNQVIRAWAYSSEYLRGTLANEIFKTIGGDHDLNGETMKLMLRAWCNSRERRSAFAATGCFMRMMKLLELGGRVDMEPSMEDYHVLFDTWTKARDKNAPAKVKLVLEMIENAYQQGLTESRADAQCFRDALITISNRADAPDVGELADSVLTEMKDRMFVPDTACYGAAILTWKNVATQRNNNNNNTDDREFAVKRALDLLREMTRAYHRTTTVVVKPTTMNYNNVLEALTVSKNPKAIEHALVLLDGLEGSHPGSEQEGPVSANVGPNADSYARVLQILRNQKSPSKVNQAVDLLRRMKDRIEEIRLFSKEKDIVQAYSEFIRVCGSAEAKTDITRTKIMTMSLRMLEEVQSLNLQPNSSTYAALLEACQNLLPEGNERQRVLEKIFSAACEEGYVNRDVLVRFEDASSSYWYAKIVIEKSIDVENIKALPESWTRNATGLSTHAGGGGGKVLPLSIDGNVTFTKTDAERRMRKLRERTNQKMLRGGRM